MIMGKEIIFLYDATIAPCNRPKPKTSIGHDTLTNITYDMSTETLDCFGFDDVHEEIGDYKIGASAVRHLAEIKHYDPERPYHDEYDKNKPRKEILFTGVIAIYKKIIPGSEIDMYDLTFGEIQTATKPDNIYKGKGGLRKLILGPNDDVSRIEAIIRGYNIQEQKRKEDQSRDNLHRYSQAEDKGRNQAHIVKN